MKAEIRLVALESDLPRRNQTCRAEIGLRRMKAQRKRKSFFASPHASNAGERQLRGEAQLSSELPGIRAGGLSEVERAGDEGAEV